MPNESVNYWKFATIGIVLVGATVAATLLVTGRGSSTESASEVAAPAVVTDQKQAALPVPMDEASAPVEEKKKSVPKTTKSAANAVSSPPPPPAYTPQAAYPPQPAYPPQSVMDACNKYAGEQVRGKAEEVLTSAALGAAIGAAVGAAGGAIAGGGKGAGKGAAIGGVTGAAGGTLYGLNETKSHDAQYQAAYASCMRSKGY